MDTHQRMALLHHTNCQSKDELSFWNSKGRLYLLPELTGHTPASITLKPLSGEVNNSHQLLIKCISGPDIHVNAKLTCTNPQGHQAQGLAFRLPRSQSNQASMGCNETGHDQCHQNLTTGYPRGPVSLPLTSQSCLNYMRGTSTVMGMWLQCCDSF